MIRNPYNWSIDAKAMGYTPNHSSIGYKGVVIWIYPQNFLDLCNDLEQSGRNSNTIDYAGKQWNESGTVAPPQLYLRRIGDTWEVYGHEGRHRATVANNHAANKIPVFIYVRGLDGSTVTRKITESLRDIIRCESHAKKSNAMLSFNTYWLDGAFYRVGEKECLPAKIDGMLMLSSRSDDTYLDRSRQYFWSNHLGDFDGRFGTYDTPTLVKIGEIMRYSKVKKNPQSPNHICDNYPKRICSSDLIEESMSIHHTPEDFEEGDVADRISAHDVWELKEIELKKIPEQPYGVSEWRVKRISDEMSSNDHCYPPIIYDEDNSDVIDGNHRLSAAIKLGFSKIMAYVPKKSHISKNPPSKGFKSIDSGGWANIYSNGDLVECIIEAGSNGQIDMSKDIMVEARNLVSENAKRFIPEIRRKRRVKNKEYTWEMPLYESIQPYEFSDDVRDKSSTTEQIISGLDGFLVGRDLEGVKEAILCFRKITERLGLYYVNDFVSHNLMQDKDGQLILIDIFLVNGSVELLERRWSTKSISKNPPSPGFALLGEGSAAKAYKKDRTVEIITRPGQRYMYDVSRDVVIDARLIIRDDLKKYLPVIRRKRIDSFYTKLDDTSRVEFVYEMPFYESINIGPNSPDKYTDYTKFGYKYPTKEQIEEIESVLNRVMADAYKKAGIKYDRRLAKFDGSYEDQDSLIFNPKFNLGWYQDGPDRIIVFRDPLYAWMPENSVFKVYGERFPEDRTGRINNSMLSSGALSRYVKGCLI
jgi:hypothetical protein